jgi:methylenetetrahydrofolate--tRNA-(uracil-5-)-methyltransferase
MKPLQFSPAHTSSDLAELVCSNSFRSDAPDSAVGLLKEEMRMADSLLMLAAEKTRVPAGKALAVDRREFSAFITDIIEKHERIEIVRQEITSVEQLPRESFSIIATGPLTSSPLADSIRHLVGREYLYFYDAIAPVIMADSIDMTKVFRQSRYGPFGEGDYLNCPMNREEYLAFWSALVKAEKVPLRDFEKPAYFEGCLPIEVMAERGEETLCYGPMKPRGLTTADGSQPHAVVQLRQENLDATMYNMVGFQTKLKWQEQQRVFRMIPGLEHAEFARLGSIHRNTFVCAPEVITPALRLKSAGHILLAGQISGVEGYVESTAMGWLAGRNAALLCQGKEPSTPPAGTAHGALVRHITNAGTKKFQPMNINFGLFPRLGKKMPKRLRGKAYAQRAMEEWKEFLASDSSQKQPS